MRRLVVILSLAVLPLAAQDKPVPAPAPQSQAPTLEKPGTAPAQAPATPPAKPAAPPTQKLKGVAATQPVDANVGKTFRHDVEMDLEENVLEKYIQKKNLNY